MDQYQAFREYEEQQHQAKVSREQQVAEELHTKLQLAIEMLKVRGQDLHTIEQKMVEQKQIMDQTSNQLQLAKEKLQVVHIQQIAEELQATNQKRNEAQIAVSQKRQDEQKVRAKGSPIEIDFREAWSKAYPDIKLLPQYSIGQYRVDFAHVETLTVIELDGHSFHSQKKDQNKDYSRQHEIEDQGWYFVRFTGSQVFNDVDSCINLAHSRIVARYGEAR